MPIPLKVLQSTLENLGNSAGRAAAMQGIDTCGPRCSTCCTRAVSVSEEEAELAANAVKAKGPGAVAAVLEAVAVWERATAQLSEPDRETGAADTIRVEETAAYTAARGLGIVGLSALAARLPAAPCPLLYNTGGDATQGLCRVYDARPSECRLHYVKGPGEGCAGRGSDPLPLLDARGARTRLAAELGLIHSDLLPLALKRRLSLQLV